MATIALMSDEKSNPVDDLKQGLGLLFRAAKGAVERLPTDKVEDVAKDAAKEVARAFESLGHEVESLIHPKKGSAPPPPDGYTQAGPSHPSHPSPEPSVPPAEQKRVDDAYAPEDPTKR
jgi:hypothetical protein